MMQAYTEEQKAALIEFNREKISSLKLAVKQHAFEGVREELEAELLSSQIILAALTAEPVGYIHKHAWREYKQAVCTGGDDGHEMYANTSNHFAVYTVPPASALRLPDAKPSWDDEDGNDIDYMEPRDIYAMGKDDGYNRCIHEVKRLNATAPQPELTVWYGSMPESNGKSNWTAMLHRKGESKSLNYMTIDRSEYPDRVRYAADRVRYLIGEISERPSILDYDADKHSGYVAPATTLPVLTLNESLYRLANHIASAKNGLPEGWQDWAEEIESDLRRMAAAPEGK